MKLRDLTEKEEAELKKIRINEGDNSYQILMGMIAIDLLNSRTQGGPVQFNDLIQCISKENMDFVYSVENRPALPPIMFTWLSMLRKYSNNRISDNDIYSLTFNLIDIVCEISMGLFGKKQSIMRRFFLDVNNELIEKTGKGLLETPTGVYRYIVSCFDYIGIIRKINEDIKMVDVSLISYKDLVDN